MSEDNLEKFLNDKFGEDALRFLRTGIITSGFIGWYNTISKTKPKLKTAFIKKLVAETPDLAERLFYVRCKRDRELGKMYVNIYREGKRHHSAFFIARELGIRMKRDDYEARQTFSYGGSWPSTHSLGEAYRKYGSNQYQCGGGKMVVRKTIPDHQSKMYDDD